MPITPSTYYISFRISDFSSTYLTESSDGHLYFSPVERGNKHQQWIVQGDPGNDARTLMNMAVGHFLVASEGVVEPSEENAWWWISSGGSGGYKVSGSANDDGPWWDTTDSVDDPRLVVSSDSTQWQRFYLTGLNALGSNPNPSTSLPVSGPSGLNGASSTRTTNTSTSPSTTNTGQQSTNASNPSPGTTGQAQGGSKGGLDAGDIAALASSIPIGVVGLVLAGLALRRKGRRGRTRGRRALRG